MLKNKLLVFIGVLAGVVKADYGKNAFAPRNDAAFVCKIVKRNFDFIISKNKK